MRRVHDESERRGSDRPIRARKPEAIEPGTDTRTPVEAKVESLQRSAGNTAVTRLLEGDEPAHDGARTDMRDLQVLRQVAGEEEKEAPMPDLLNPEPLTEEELKEGGGPQPQKAGEFGEAEGVAYEIRVLAPLRRALSAASQQEWETAVGLMQEPGAAMMDYEAAYKDRDPVLAAELFGARGWIGQAVNQMRARYTAVSFTDDQIVARLSEAVGDLEGLSKRFG